MTELPQPLDESALRIQELAYGLKVRDVMTRKIFAVTRTCTMRDVQTIMKNNGISGVPVVDDSHVVGIISMNDIMNAFVDGYMDDAVDRHMVPDVQTLSDEVPVTFAMSAFSKYSFRRFPVVNQKNELVGIITETDIFKVLLEMMGARDEGIRLNLIVLDEPGTLSKIAGAIASIGGDIVALGSFYSDEHHNRGNLMIKVCCVSNEALLAAMESIDVTVAGTHGA